MKTIILISENEIKKSVERFLHYIERNEIETCDPDLEKVIGRIKALQAKILLIIDDFVKQDRFEGVALVKRIKIFCPAYKLVEKDNKEAYFHIPILFLCNDEVWRIEIASLRAGRDEIFGEENSFWHHLNVLKGISFLKIPFSIKDFIESVDFLLKTSFKTDPQRMMSLSALLGYEEHSKHH